MAVGFSPRSRRRATAFGAVLASLGALLAWPAPLASAAAAAPTVNAVVVSPSSVSVSGKQTRLVTVTLQLVVAGGQQSSPTIVDTGHGVDLAPVPMTLTSGTDDNGSWQAELVAGSMMEGAHPLAVEVCPDDGRDCATAAVRVTLGAAGVVTVNGSNWPVLTRIHQEPRRLAAGHTSGAKATSRVVYSQTRKPVRGVAVVLRRGRDGSAVVADRTHASGVISAPWPWPSQRGSASLWLRLPGLPGVSFGRHNLGFPTTSYAVVTTHSPAVASTGHRYRVSGYITPVVSAKRLGSVVLEIRRGDRWVALARSKPRPVSARGATSRAHFTLTTSIRDVGIHVLRVRKTGTMCGTGRCRVAEGVSDRFDVVTGNRTYFVERRLASLSVPVGAVDGVVDARTRQALCAWRDMAGSKPSRSGVTRAVANSVLSAHHLPSPKRSDGLYVDKTCQILLQVVNQHFRRVVWASSGQPGFGTPSGTGAIFRKLPGPVESTLYPGAFMYHPMFFFSSRPAIALHGSATNDLVLPYPASHGCVRVWRPDINEIYRESPLGTKVQVYGRY